MSRRAPGPWLGVGLIGLAGCGGAGMSPAPMPEGADAWARNVSAFEVRDADGEVVPHPFLGGLNVPRPQLVDIDGDGGVDLFLQEYSDEVMFFQGHAPSADPSFTWRTGTYQNLAIGEWYRFIDLDQDGDFDLLTEQPFSHIRYYRNDGGPTAPRFVLAADTLRQPDGTPVFADRQNIPNVTDIDCNGLLDLFIGRIEGTVMRYEEVRRNPDGAPRFRLVTERFEDIEIVAQIGGSRHGANTMAFADFDRDGDQDLFWGDFFEAGLLLIENTGTCRAPILRGEPTPFPVGDPIATSGYNAPTFGDVDGDGDLDMFMGVLGGAFNPNRTTIDNLHYLQDAGGGDFTHHTARVLGTIDVGSESIPAFADLDGDGDLDFWVANKIDQTNLQSGRIYPYENVGTPRAPAFEARPALPFEGAYHYAPAFGDLDGDGDLDLLMGTWRRGVAYYRNDGTPREPTWTLVDSAFVTLTRGSNTTPALADVDGDGDLDLMVGEGSGTLNYYRNDGGASAPVYSLVSDEYGGIDIGRRSAPTFADIDGDGDVDLVVGSEGDQLAVFRNDGTPTEPNFVADPDGLGIIAPPFAVPVLVDIDADGRLDLFMGGIGGGIVYWARP